MFDGPPSRREPEEPPKPRPDPRKVYSANPRWFSEGMAVRLDIRAPDAYAMRHGLPPGTRMYCRCKVVTAAGHSARVVSDSPNVSEFTRWVTTYDCWVMPADLHA